MIKITIFQGELPYISAKKEAMWPLYAITRNRCTTRARVTRKIGAIFLSGKHNTYCLPHAFLFKHRIRDHCRNKNHNSKYNHTVFYRNCDITFANSIISSTIAKMHMFRIHKIVRITKQRSTWRPVFLFSKSITLFFGYFDPVNICLIIKINNFRGDLSGISAKK